jgi:hypothetical protein
MPILGSTAGLIDDVTGGPNERTGLLSAALTTGINTNIRDFMAMWVDSAFHFCLFLTGYSRELHLQIKLISLQKLLSQVLHSLHRIP